MTSLQKNTVLSGALVIALVFCAIFVRSFDPRLVAFSNDGPLGATSTQALSMPSGFFGVWTDLNWVGSGAGSVFLSVTYSLFTLLGPLWYAKFYTPISLILLGIAATLFFRQLGFRGATCILGGLAAALNMDFFSNACWGLGVKALAAAAAFLALAALAGGASGARGWIRVLLAGFAVGLGILDAADVGAIFSLYVAAAILFGAWMLPQPVPRRLLVGATRLAVVAGFAAVVATQALIGLVGTQIRGIASFQAQMESDEQRWHWATQWSLPKIETLRVLIPGLYGYRMDSPKGGNYWGTVGQQPGWEQHRQGLIRYSGSGEYAGVLVVLVALWGLVQASRKQGGPFSQAERRWIWFWGAAAVVSLLLAYGRHAPFYQLLYSLPYFSTIRNPIKFMHPFQFSLVILFAYGLEGIWRVSAAPGTAAAATFKESLSRWWSGGAGVERRWRLGLMALLLASVLGWLGYSAARPALVRHLQAGGFDITMAAEIASFSIGEVGWYVLFLALSIALLASLLGGYWSGPRARWADLAIGAFLILDLYRANRPWIMHYDYRDKYASNPVIDILRQQPHEQRVALLPFAGDQTLEIFQQLYQIEWLQHLFQYYNIHSLDVIQEPREAADNRAFRGVFPRNNAALFPRLWQLTSTRYLLGRTGSEKVLNEQLDPALKRFRIHTTFDLQAKPNRRVGPDFKLEDFTAVLRPEGALAIIEFTGALPRARLYDQWTLHATDQETLERLADPVWDPAATVFVAGSDAPAPAPASETGDASVGAGTVAYVSYAPKDITLRAESSRPSILLLNDKFDPHWSATVNGAPATVLRCNFLMRGVHLPAGTHTVEFRFRPPPTGFKISLAAVCVGLALTGLVSIPSRPIGGGNSQA